MDTSSATELLVSKHYDTLKWLARERRRRSKHDHTMMTTDILHESWLKIRESSDWRDENHFLKSAAQAMRHVLVDYARAKMTNKRAHNGKYSIDEMSEYLPEFSESPEQIVAISDLRDRLKKINTRYKDVLDLRYFGGFTEEEAARILDVSARTIRRDWVFIKAWIAHALEET